MTTTIDLPTDLKRKVEQTADARGVSLDELIKEALEWMLAQSDSDDPLYADEAVYSGDTPADLSAHHDKYLYDDAT